MFGHLGAKVGEQGRKMQQMTEKVGFLEAWRGGCRVGAVGRSKSKLVGAGWVLGGCRDVNATKYTLGPSRKPTIWP